MVYKVLMDPEKNRATGVMYIDRVTRAVKEVHAKVVILCAQALESTRILLNSSTKQYQNGLANSSGALGHYLMDHLWVAGGARGEFPDAADEAVDGRAQAADGHLRDPHAQHGQRTAPQGPHPRVRVPGRRRNRLQLRRARLRRGLQEGGHGPGHQRGPGRVRRSARALRQLHRDRSERRRHLRHPGDQDHDVVG